MDHEPENNNSDSDVTVSARRVAEAKSSCFGSPKHSLREKDLDAYEHTQGRAAAIIEKAVQPDKQKSRLETYLADRSPEVASAHKQAQEKRGQDGKAREDKTTSAPEESARVGTAVTAAADVECTTSQSPSGNSIPIRCSQQVSAQPEAYQSGRLMSPSYQSEFKRQVNSRLPAC
jgi:hypothetical protein